MEQALQLELVKEEIEARLREKDEMFRRGEEQRRREQAAASAGALAPLDLWVPYSHRL